MKPSSRSFPLLLLALSLLAAADIHAATRPGEEDDDNVKFDNVEALKKKAATEGDWALGKNEQVAVNQTVLTKPWNKTPFDGRMFNYTPEQIKANWPVLMRGIRAPYPSPEYLRDRVERFPVFSSSIQKATGQPFDGDYERLSRETVDVWRLFFKGDYQAAMQKGEALGVAGQIPGKLSQMMYAIYLEPNLEHKHMLLQDTANRVREYGHALDTMRKEKAYHDDYVMVRLGYAYAIGRIAEDVPVTTAIARNYVFKLMDAANDINDLVPNHALGIAFRAGIDANVVRKVGKATGRITFGAKQSEVKDMFEKSFTIVPDMAILRFEYANAMLYLDKKRQIDVALAELKKATTMQPKFAMEALDAMYAAKRAREIESLAKFSGSFRSFERKRLDFQKGNNQNLYCVLPNTCPPFLIVPEPTRQAKL